MLNIIIIILLSFVFVTSTGDVIILLDNISVHACSLSYSWKYVLCAHCNSFIVETLVHEH